MIRQTRPSSVFGIFAENWPWRSLRMRMRKESSKKIISSQRVVLKRFIRQSGKFPKIC